MSGYWFAAILVAVMAWYAVGVWSFIYWWTHEFDFGSEHIAVAAFAGLLGPLSWFIGWSIHGSPTVYIRKRGGSA